MKTSVIFLAGMLIAGVAFGQNQKPLNDCICVQPVFNGINTTSHAESLETINDYLKKYVEYPSTSINCGLQGTEVVQFVITPKGEITDFSVINSVCPKIDEEVIRILKTTNGKWIPGSVNGEAVNMKNEVSLSFLLHESNDLAKMAASYQQKGNKWMFEKNNPEKALKYYNRAIVLLPGEESLLAMRGFCNYKMGNIASAEKDWNRIKLLAKYSTKSKLENLAELFSETNGYSEMMATIKR